MDRWRAYAATGLVVAGIHGLAPAPPSPANAFHRPGAMSVALLIGAAGGPAPGPSSGDPERARFVAHWQPVKTGRPWKATSRPSAGAPLRIGGWPDRGRPVETR